MANIADIIKRKMKEAAKESGADVIIADEESDGADEALTDALGDVFDAIKDDDREAGISALKAAIKISHEECCGSDADEE